METFIADMTKALQKPLIKGDYDGLVQIIGALCKIKDKALEADNMFEPLAQTIELLKEYGIEFPEELHELLSVGVPKLIRLDISKLGMHPLAANFLNKTTGRYL